MPRRNYKARKRLVAGGGGGAAVSRKVADYFAYLDANPTPVGRNRRHRTARTKQKDAA
ncbi:MAG: hypothetical protein ACSLEY_00110 [Candidatus Saccharimonadales bacterium]